MFPSHTILLCLVSLLACEEGFLGQESFPLSEVEYEKSIADKLEILNRCGYSEEVREWLKKVNDRPRLGRAVSLQLNVNEKMKEFLI